MKAVAAEQESYKAFHTNPLYIKGKQLYLLSAKLNINKQCSSLCDINITIGIHGSTNKSTEALDINCSC